MLLQSNSLKQVFAYFPLKWPGLWQCLPQEAPTRGCADSLCASAIREYAGVKVRAKIAGVSLSQLYAWKKERKGLHTEKVKFSQTSRNPEGISGLSW